MSLISVNPATGCRIASYREHSRADIEKNVARAATDQRRWRALAASERAKYFVALARELRAKRDALADLATAEMGKPVTQARAEVEKCAVLCDFFAEHGARLLADEVPAGGAGKGRVVHEPLGVVLAIMPWNFPYWQAIRAAVPALAGGNAVLLKHAPNVPGCAVALEAAFRKAGFSRGVFQALLIGTKPVPGLIADARIHAVTLTGSTGAGKAVAALAGAAMKPGVYELGGSDPALVLAGADLELAAEACASARLLNTGQSCVCAKRFVVVRSVLKEFEERFVARIAARRVGDPADPATDVGPLARADLRDHLHQQVAQSVRRGARVLLGGKPLPGPGYFYAPTVLTGVKPGMAAYDEETFGPVAAIIVARDEKDAVRIANDTPYGLGASIYTTDAAQARRVAGQLEVGNVFVNEIVRSSSELPFGGIKQSGYGRELGEWGAKTFVNVKTVVGIEAKK